MNREEQFEKDLLKIADFSEQPEYKGKEINRWTRIALRALGEFLRPKEAIMVESGGHRWFVWRIDKLKYRFLNPNAEANKALKDMKVATWVKVTRVTPGAQIPTQWEEI